MRQDVISSLLLLDWVQFAELLRFEKIQERPSFYPRWGAFCLSVKPAFFFCDSIVIKNQPQEEMIEEDVEEQQEFDDGKKTLNYFGILFLFCSFCRVMFLIAMYPSAQRRSQRALRISHQRSWTGSDWRRSRRKSCALQALAPPSYPTPMSM